MKRTEFDRIFNEFNNEINRLHPTISKNNSVKTRLKYIYDSTKQNFVNAINENKFKNIPNVKFKQKDITQLNDINEKYDIIICTWVLSHLQSPSQVINQAQKLLSQKGKMFLIFFSKPKWFINIWLY